MLPNCRCSMAVVRRTPGCELDRLGGVLVGGDSDFFEDLVDVGSDVFSEFPVGSGDVFFEFSLVSHANEGAGDGGVIEDPGEGELGDGLVVAVGELDESVGDLDFLAEVFVLEEGQVEGHAAAVASRPLRRWCRA